MTDLEIKQYLEEHHWAVRAQDCLIHVLNRSYQITDTDYDFETGMMTIKTPDHDFTFKWILGSA